MDKFWSSSSNKMQLQQSFIEWMKANYIAQKPLYLGGANKEDMTSCYKVVDGNITLQPLLKCTHEEADDRLMFHINHALQIDNFTKVIVASSDADIFVNLIYHFTCWQFSNLEELWMLSGKKSEQQAVPIHDLVAQFDGSVIDVLPAVHALTGTYACSLFDLAFFENENINFCI